MRRWFAVLLVLGKLVLGASAHAMPQTGAHDAHAPELPSAAQTEEEPCPDHVNGGSDAQTESTSTTSADEAGAEHDSNHSERDCCKAGGCKCPCAHASVYLAQTAPVHVVSIEHSRAVFRGIPLAPFRLTAVFRPPA